MMKSQPRGWLFVVIRRRDLSTLVEMTKGPSVISSAIEKSVEISNHESLSAGALSIWCDKMSYSYAKM